MRERCVKGGGEIRHRMGGDACGLDIASGKHDLHVRGKQPGTGHAVLRFVHRAAGRRFCGIGLSLGQP